MRESGERFLIDSYAWVEYFTGSKIGMRAKSYIESGSAYTPTIVIAEISSKFERDAMDFSRALKFIETKTGIVDLDRDIAARVGKIDVENRTRVEGWGIVDSIIVSTSKSMKAKVVTGDEHFRNVKEAIMIK